MTHDDIIRMARKAGTMFELGEPHGDMVLVLERFAALVATAEREECAKRLEAVGCDHCAANIRLRGQE